MTATASAPAPALFPRPAILARITADCGQRRLANIASKALGRDVKTVTASKDGATFTSTNATVVKVGVALINAGVNFSQTPA